MKTWVRFRGIPVPCRPSLVLVAALAMLAASPSTLAQSPGAAAIVTDLSGLPTSEQFGFVNQWKLTNSGEVYFTASFNSGLFRWSPVSGMRQRILQANDSLDGVLPPEILLFLPPGLFVDVPAISLQAHPSGKIAFATSVVLAGDAEPVGNLVYDGTAFRLVITELSVISQQAVNSSGRIAVAGYPDGLSNGPFRLLLETPSGDLKLIAEQGSASPAGLGGNVASITLLGITESGRAIFLVGVNGGSTPLALLVSDGDKTSAIARSNDAVEGGSRITLRAAASNYFVNDAGEVVFAADATGGPAGIWIASASSSPAAVVRLNDNTGTPLNGTFTGNLTPRGFNNAGQVLFSANIAGGSSTHGLFLKDRGAAPKVVFSRGQLASGAARFEATMQASLNSTGKVAFLASLSASTAPVGWFLGSASSEPVLIAAEGGKSPVGGSLGLSDNNMPALINDSAQVVFQADLLGANAVALLSWTADGGLASVVSHLDPLPDGAREMLRSMPASFNLRSENEFVVRAMRAGGRVGYYAVDSRSGASYRRIMAECDPLPSGGAVISIGAMSLNNKGEALFLGQVHDPASYPLVSLLASRPDAGLRKIVSSGDPAPGGGRILSFGTPQLNSLSQFALTATTDANGTSNALLFGSLDDTTLQRLIAIGDPVSNAGSQTVAGISGVIALSESGLVAGFGSISGPNRAAIFITAPGLPVAKVVAVGDPAPIGNFNGITNQVRINSDGKVAFLSNIGNATFGGPGIFVGSASDPPQPIVISGSPVPGADNVNFNFFDPGSMSLNSSGQVAFWANLCCQGPASAWFVGAPGAHPQARVYSTQPLPAGGTASYPSFGPRVAALADSGELAVYIPFVDGSDFQPQIVVAGVDGALRSLAAGGAAVPGDLGVFGKPNPAIFVTPSGRFIFSSLLQNGPAQAAVFTSLP